MILMTLVIVLIAAWAGISLSSCSSDDTPDDITDCFPTNLYGVIINKDADAFQMEGVSWREYALTLNDNIVAYDPESGYMKLTGAQDVTNIAYPLPEQRRIAFFSNGTCLFSALLNSELSSFYGGGGLMFMHMLTDSEGNDLYKLEHITVGDGKGNVEGLLTEREQQGLKIFEDILREHGKITSNVLELMVLEY